MPDALGTRLSRPSRYKPFQPSPLCSMEGNMIRGFNGAKIQVYLVEDDPGCECEETWGYRHDQECCECGKKGAWRNVADHINPLGLCDECLEYEVHAGRMLLMSDEKFDLREEAKEAIERYYLSSEGQNEILFALQKGGKWRTLCKKYTKGAMGKLIEAEMIHVSTKNGDPGDKGCSGDVFLIHNGLQRVFELTLKGGTDAKKTKGV